MSWSESSLLCAGHSKECSTELNLLSTSEDREQEFMAVEALRGCPASSLFGVKVHVSAFSLSQQLWLFWKFQLVRQPNVQFAM